MNCMEHCLPVREALQSILHTILFLRAPGPVTPEDVHCEGFDFTYARIAHHDSATSANAIMNAGTNAAPMQPMTGSPDEKVDAAIEKLLQTLTPIGPELLSGCLTLSFYEKARRRQGLFGFMQPIMPQGEDKVIWEQWVIRVVVNNTPRPVNDDSASVIERQRIQDTSEGMIRAAMLRIFELVGSTSMDHIPPGEYQFEINCTKKAAIGNDQENIYARVKNMPALINLG
eukprot:CAMPEP_0116017702 /NCGR_PEP_ID=MMETSP0321-20121206/8207_1 /TAXON_ID=163516 /ORGANISM="Leptocylindrus danicus var. danicus, Strain B650" /LENGTH=228 /DNA_ID=CAMNT_0003487949 /DNA_START=76 /DNA_END=762 /DNA_ORIENTATION=+